MATATGSSSGFINAYIPSSTQTWRDWSNIPTTSLQVERNHYNLIAVNFIDKHAVKTRIQINFMHTGSLKMYLFRTQPTYPDADYLESNCIDSATASGASTSALNILNFSVSLGYVTKDTTWYIAIQNTDSSDINLSAISLFAHYTYDDTPPSISLIKPVETSVDGSTEIEFKWAISHVEDIQYSKLEYSYDSESWTEIKAFYDSTISYYAPAKKFNPGTVYWRVKSATYYSNESTSATSYFTALESLPYVTVFEQNGKYQKREEPITFTWKTYISYGSITGAELQYSSDNGENWTPLGSVDGTGTSYTVPANTFPAVAYSDAASRTGGIRLRIRSKNGDQQYGSWYSGSFATVDAPISAVPTAPRYGAAVDETTAITFSFNTENPICAPPSDVDIRWKVSDGEWQYLEHLAESMTPGTGSGNPLGNTVVVPANTFSVSVIYYQVRAYNQDGVAGDWSSEAYFSTIDAPSVATPISPVGTIEDTDSDLVFRWSASSTSGSTPTGADLQYSYDGTTWLELGHADGSTQLTVSGETIHSGTVQWRVRSYNRNGTAGDWSSPAIFVARAAPRVLEVLADGKPFTTITWQATDQQTYQIEVDEAVYGSFFGTEKTFQLPNYLEDGTHTVKVYVQNEMDIWSKPGELTFTVLNVPGDRLRLSGDFDLDAELFWDDESDRSDYLVYRDGQLIGEASQRAFTDRVVLGEHTYYVVNRFPSGYYSKSNEVECTLSTDVTQIALLSGGEWMPLEKSENSRQTQRFTHSRNVAYHHFSGDKNPTPEVSDEEDLVGEFDAAWFYTEEGAKKLKSLLGQALIIKSRGEEVVIGVLEAYTKVNRKHFRGYAFNIHQMEWKDYICAE